MLQNGGPQHVRAARLVWLVEEGNVGDAQKRDKQQRRLDCAPSKASFSFLHQRSLTVGQIITCMRTELGRRRVNAGKAWLLSRRRTRDHSVFSLTGVTSQITTCFLELPLEAKNLFRHFSTRLNRSRLNSSEVNLCHSSTKTSFF